ncbi:hypothetical protein CsSME_00021965 [Camellia sinensis var. sinensis]
MENLWKGKRKKKKKLVSIVRFNMFDMRIGMAHTEMRKESSNLESCDAYFETIQSRKKLPLSLQETLTAAFARIPVSSFPEVPGGHVIEILADTSISDTVKILSQHNILSAPVRNPDAGNSVDWRERYLGIIDYSAIVLWVLEIRPPLLGLVPVPLALLGPLCWAQRVPLRSLGWPSLQSVQQWLVVWLPIKG